jgi:hypothetical protein
MNQLLANHCFLSLLLQFHSVTNSTVAMFHVASVELITGLKRESKALQNLHLGFQHAAKVALS